MVGIVTFFKTLDSRNRADQMRLKTKWVVLWSLWAARLVRQPTAPLLVSNGWLTGSVAPSGTHNQYFGIPYATIPERFQAPGPEPVWEDIFDAINENVRCRQTMGLGSNKTVGQDDCLILNVYTPLGTSESSSLPVMVFIHGGGFFQGSSSSLIYGPEYLINKDIILITLNYRLNIQGFLCLRIKEAPGNAGMKDQVAALRWIRRNIRSFGGDPDNVTLFGESAGSASVSFHVLSPMSKDLFQKAILQSGSALSSWAYQFKPVYMASLLAKTMGYTTQDPYELYKIFSEKSNTELIVTRVPRKEGNLIISEILYSPCVEDVIKGVEPFLTEIPHNVLSEGKFNKVPLIIGRNDEEGLFFIRLENDTTMPKITFERSLAKDLIFSSEEEKIVVANKAKKIYMGNDEISEETLVKFSRFSGDMYINYPALEETTLIARASDEPVYNYLFAYSSWRNIPKLTSGKPVSNGPGAVHADELFYIFSQNVIASLFETDMIQKVSTLWTNFAKYGDPTPSTTGLLPVKWPPVVVKSPLSLKIDSQFSIIPMWYSDSVKFWQEVYSKYRRKER